MNELYRFLRLTKQAVSKCRKRQELFDAELRELVPQVDLIREEHPGCGVEKMYYSLQPKFMGRDKFIEIFMSLGYGLQKVRNYCRTTYPSHISYPNLIEGMSVDRPYQVIQSDITYYDLNGKFYYLIFIIDVYTKEILSYQVSYHIRAEANVMALKIALKKMEYTPGSLIHHSDRGTQYSSNEYRNLLTTNEIHISMGLIAQDNAYAERINGTIKNEYLKRWVIRDEKELKLKTKKAVEQYNLKRKHNAFKNKFSPLEFKEYLVALGTKKRPKVIIYAEGNKELKKAFSHLEFDPKKEPLAHNCPIRENESSN